MIHVILLVPLLGMAEQKRLKENIEINKNFDLLTRSYQEHAIGQITFARYSVLYSRGFAEDLSEIFFNIKSSYAKKLELAGKESTVKKNDKELWILITANSKLYGDIVYRTCKLFLRRLKMAKRDKVDIVIIGRQGKNFFDEAGVAWPYMFLDIPDTKFDIELLRNLIKKLSEYEIIYTFYSRYDNLISQVPIQAVLSGEIKLDEEKTGSDMAPGKKQKYLFEPGIEEIQNFFESQIITLLLNQTIREAQLARYASRINAMEEAQTNIHKQLTFLKKEERAERIKNLSRQQVELLAGKRLWNRK